jgi:hypothetical protein
MESLQKIEVAEMFALYHDPTARQKQCLNAIARPAAQVPGNLTTVSDDVIIWLTDF